MLDQVEKAIEIVKAQKESMDWGSMGYTDSETVLNCLYRLRHILMIKEARDRESEEWYE
jgi:hypothetical protein